jgi:hypothetical protein
MQFNFQIEIETEDAGFCATVRNTDTGEAFCYDADKGWIPEAEELERGNALCFGQMEDALDKCQEQVRRLFVTAWLRE